MNNPYQVCYECEHVYPTARSLRRAYRRAFWVATGSNAYQPRVPLIVRLWRIATIRSRKVYFCQDCTHDFLYPPGSWNR